MLVLSLRGKRKAADVVHGLSHLNVWYYNARPADPIDSSKIHPDHFQTAIFRKGTEGGKSRRALPPS